MWSGESRLKGLVVEEIYLSYRWVVDEVMHSVEEVIQLIGSDRSSRCHSVRLSICLSVCPFGTKCSIALNLHLIINQTRSDSSQTSIM